MSLLSDSFWSIRWQPSLLLNLPYKNIATKGDPGGHHFVYSLIYILTLFWGASLGRNAKFLLTLTYEKRRHFLRVHNKRAGLEPVRTRYLVVCV